MKNNCNVAIGDLVTIIASPYGDVSVGATGEVVSLFSGGYGVQIEGQFTNALDTHNRKAATRILWFEGSQIKVTSLPSPLRMA